MIEQKPTNLDEQHPTPGTSRCTFVAGVAGVAATLRTRYADALAKS